jgi:type IV pilus assembly protein PilA
MPEKERERPREQLQTALADAVRSAGRWDVGLGLLWALGPIAFVVTFRLRLPFWGEVLLVLLVYGSIVYGLARTGRGVYRLLTGKECAFFSQLLVVAAIIVVAAVAIPSLLRSRVSPGESSHIGDIRSVISAQQAYQSANGGYYAGRLECLSDPWATGCIPSYPTNAPTFLDSAIGSGQPKGGYVRSFTAAPAPMTVDTTATGRNSAIAFLYAATPQHMGRSGVRSYAGDASGLICYRQGGDEIPANANGRLIPGPDCIILR